MLIIDQEKYLGVPLDGEVALVGQDGKGFRLKEWLGKPLILVLSYFTCDGACPTINRAMARTVLAAERFRPGKDYRVLTLSFDPNDTPQSMHHFVHKVGLPEEARRGWRFALFKHKENIARFTGRLGYRYFWSARDKVFMHPNVYLFVSPQGRVVRYLYGAKISPRDIELAVIESDWNRLTSSSRAIDILSGVCFSYNFKEGRYTLNYPLFVAAASLILGVAAVVFSFIVYRHRKRGRLINA